MPSDFNGIATVEMFKELGEGVGTMRYQLVLWLVYLDSC